MTWHTYDVIVHDLLVLAALVFAPAAFIYAIHEIVVEYLHERKSARVHHPASVRSYVVPIPRGRVYDWQQEEQREAAEVSETGAGLLVE